MTDRYGNTRVAKIRAVYNDLRAAIRSGDIETAERALDRYEPWADYLYGQTVSTWVANDASAALAAMLKAEREKAYERAAPIKVGEAAIAGLLDRRGLREPLSEVKFSDPEIWAEICEEAGNAAIRALAQEDE